MIYLVLLILLGDAFLLYNAYKKYKINDGKKI